MKETSYDRAVARVKKIKGFYNHLVIYVIFLMLWMVFAGRFFGLIGASIGDADDGFFEWANINLWLNPLIWTVIIIVHGIYVFGFKYRFFKDWEERKLQEYLNEETTETKNRYE